MRQLLPFALARGRLPARGKRGEEDLGTVVCPSPACSWQSTAACPCPCPSSSRPGIAPMPMPIQLPPRHCAHAHAHPAPVQALRPCPCPSSSRPGIAPVTVPIQLPPRHCARNRAHAHSVLTQALRPSYVPRGSVRTASTVSAHHQQRQRLHSGLDGRGPLLEAISQWNPDPHVKCMSAHNV